MDIDSGTHLDTHLDTHLVELNLDSGMRLVVVDKKIRIDLVER